MFWFIYHLPLHTVAVSVILAPVVWALFMFWCSPKGIKILNLLALAVSFSGIVWMTLLRSSSGERELILLPFNSFAEALEEREMYRSMLMNVALFVPFGITLPYVLKSKAKPVAKAILICLVLTLLIEILQYAFAIGRSEADDVICNTLGGAIGALSYIISEKLQCKVKKAKTE